MIVADFRVYKKAFDYNTIKGFFCKYFAVRTGLPIKDMTFDNQHNT